MLKVIRTSPRASAAILVGLLIVAALAVHARVSRLAPPPEPTKVPESTSTETPSPTELPPTSTPTPTIPPDPHCRPGRPEYLGPIRDGPGVADPHAVQGPAAGVDHRIPARPDRRLACRRRRSGRLHREDELLPGLLRGLHAEPGRAAGESPEYTRKTQHWGRSGPAVSATRKSAGSIPARC
jgi:hypothetical protein